MKKLLMLAAAAAAILPMTAQAAESAEGAIALNANASNTCAIRGITAGSGTVLATPFNNTTGGAASATATLNLGNDAMDPTTALTLATTKNLTLNAFCNYATHNVSLKSTKGGLVNAAATTTVGDFNRRIHYTANITGWDSTSAVASFTTTGLLTSASESPDTGSSPVTAATNVTNANLVITTVADTTNPLLAGSFGDTLTVKLGAIF
jgi:hypothetical protein